MISSVKVNPKKTMNNFLVIKEGRQTQPLQGGGGKPGMMKLVKRHLSKGRVRKKC